MSFIQRGSETRIYRIFSDNNLDGMYVGYLSPHNTLTSLDDDADVFIWLSKIEYRIEQAFKTTYYI